MNIITLTQSHLLSPSVQSRGPYDFENEGKGKGSKVAGKVLGHRKPNGNHHHQQQEPLFVPSVYGPHAPHYDHPTYDTPEHIHHVAPQYVEPQPAYVVPEPVYVAPEAAYVAPEPTYVAPEATYVAPEQSYGVPH